MGIMPSISACIHAFSEKGDKILLQIPSYYVFPKLIEGINQF